MLVCLQINSPSKFDKLAFALVMLSLVLGCDEKKRERLREDAKFDKAMPNWTTLLGVSSDNAPNGLLLKWLRPHKVPESDLVQIDQAAIENLKTAVSFDCTSYLLDDTLKQALQEAPELRWLRIGRHATSDDLPWICELTNLQGLSLSKADMSSADFSLFQNLKDLEWLNMRGIKLPQTEFRPFKLPQLEVWVLSSQSATNKHLPALGQFPKLQVFSVKHSQVDDDGIRQLVRANPELRYLHIYNVQGITSKSVPELAKLKRLQYLHVGTTRLEQEQLGKEWAVSVLQKQLPNCLVAEGS